MSSFFLAITLCAATVLHFLPFLTGSSYSYSYSYNTDHASLLEIKAKITHDPLGVMSSWNDTLDMCEWHGVACGRRHKRVTALDLQSLELTGTLSPWIGNLSFLRELKLQNNSFSSIIPSEIGYLQRLETLLMYNNSFGGEIPSNISSCCSLVKLHLYGNRLVGSIPDSLQKLSKLTFLSLSVNNFTGTIPSSLGNLSSLVRLSIATTNLVGRIPTSLGRLKNLASFLVANNNLFGTVPSSIFNLSALEKIDLGENHLEGRIPTDIGSTLPKVRFFSISNNLYSGHIPASISNASYIQTLQLAGNKLRGQVPSLNRLERLQNLIIYANSLGNGQITDLNFMSSLSNTSISMLNDLDLSENNFGGVFPINICNSTLITFLSLAKNKMAGEIPNCIENLAYLQVFDTRLNQFVGAIPSGIGKLQRLYNLHFGDNRLSGYIPDSIGNLTLLTILALSKNNLQGHIPSTLGNCSYLIGLDLSQNQLNGSIPSELLSLSSLSITLQLSSNQLTGPLPREVGKLTNLDDLQLYENMLSGELPSTLSSCLELTRLYVDGNLFQGNIPPALKSLQGLRELDLSRNNFSGKIPKFLANLQLKRLNLSYNMLEGEVPIGGVFNNAIVVSILGNKRLCGGIPELKLPHCNLSQIAPKKRSNHTRKLTAAIISGFVGVVSIVALIVSLYFLCCRKRTKQPTSSGQSRTLPYLSYQTLLKATNGFSSENLIGSGTFGAVYKGNLDVDGATIAIKILKLEYHGALKSFMAECDVLRSIRHRNLVKVITACSSVDYQGRDFKALIYEYMANGSLEDWLHPAEANRRNEGASNNSRSLSFPLRLNIAVDVACALDYLHHHCSTSVVHCDLKPSNVLLDDDMVAHVGDFGLAKFLPKGMNDSQANQSSSIGVRGTIGYAPPEYGVGNEVSIRGDAYSFGILLLEMFTGKRPTDDMFKEGISLHGFVKQALPEQVTKILDQTLLEDIDGLDTDFDLMLEALTSVLGIALSCSTEAPEERLDMSDAAVKLSLMKKKLLGGTRLQQRRRIQAGNAKRFSSPNMLIN